MCFNIRFWKKRKKRDIGPWMNKSALIKNVTWDGLVMFKGERLMHLWGRMSWLKLREQKNVEESQK